MADRFIGRQVHLTLKNNQKLYGVIQNVENGQLSLSNVMYDSGLMMPLVTLSAANIGELDVLPDQQAPQAPVPVPAPAPSSNGNGVRQLQQQKVPPRPQQHQQQHPKQPQPQQFSDPAILSAGLVQGGQRQAPITQPSTSTSAFNDSSDESSVDEDPYTAEEHRIKEQKKTKAKKKSAPSAPSTPKQQKSKRKQHNYQNSISSNNNGWASEDLSEIKDTEFDIQANLKLFNKNEVFDELSKSDTLMGQRLVDHNKIDPHQVKYGNRQMVLPTAAPPPPVPAPSTSEGGIQQLRHGSTSNPRSIAQLVTLNENQPCPCASPLQLQEIERVMNSCGISEEMAIENAARGISQLVAKVLGGASRFSSSNHNAKPLVVILVGNNQAGRRALAAGRHLANRHVNVVAMSVGDCGSCHQQMQAFLSSTKSKIETKLENLISTLNSYDSPPELIIDGLQGYQVTVEDLWEEDATTALGLIDWANRERAGIISLDIPSGLDPSTGLPSPVVTQYIHAKWVLSCGLPLTGVLNAHLAEIISRHEWTHYLIDIGVPRHALTSTSSLRKFTKIWFGAEWLVEMAVEK